MKPGVTAGRSPTPSKRLLGSIRKFRRNKYYPQITQISNKLKPINNGAKYPFDLLTALQRHEGGMILFIKNNLRKSGAPG
jgi:hypothetical protein